MTDDEKETCPKRKDIVIPRETTFEKYEIPENLKVWEEPHSYTQEYAEMMEDLSAICDHICKLLNEGPEVKESISKRMLTLRVIFKLLLLKTFANNFDRIGLLEQIIFDIMYEQQMRIAVAAYQRQMQEQSKEQHQREKTYVQ